MNQEEFDNRLGESFKNEHLPPDKRLWGSISSRLDENKKKSFWVWLLPVIIVVSAIGALLANGLLPSKTNTASEPATAPVIRGNTLAPENASRDTKIFKTNLTEAKNETPKLVESENDETPVKPRENNEVFKITPHHKAVIKDNPAKDQSLTDNETSRQTTSNDNSRSGLQYPNNIIEYPYLKMMGFFHPQRTVFVLPKEDLIVFNYPETFKKAKVLKSPYTKNPVDFDNKWRWSFGMGPQIAYNKAVIPNDSQEWVHKHLWANKDKMSHNGSGFQSQLLLGRRFGKYFSIESGLQYSLRTEDIRFNMVSYSIETRDTNNKITAYEDSLKLALTINGVTTYYNATRGFSMAVKNKYKIITIPVKFNMEFNINDNTSFFTGIGLGLSAITTKSATHLNLINDMETIDKKTYQFTASLNAQLGFYTNFNDVGQLGIYSGFQMYTKPWELSNKQYAIRMSDLQFGLSFRRPLNW